MTAAIDAAPVCGAEGIGDIYSEYRGLLFARALETLGDPADAEDVVQGVFAEALERGGSGSPRRLLHQVGWRARDLRKRREQPATPTSCVVDPDPAWIAEQRALLAAVIADQAPGPRRRLLRWLAGWGITEQAGEAREPYSTVAMALLRARQRAERVRDEWFRVLLYLPGLGRWLRRRASRPATADPRVVETFLHAITAVALVALGTGAGGWQTSSPSGGSSPRDDRSATRQLARYVESVGAPTVPADSAADRSNPAESSAAVTVTVPRPPLSPPLRGTPMVPWDETPEDVQLIDAVPSPHYNQDHTVVAIGMGASCRCPTLLRSSDGGSTWSVSLFAPPSAAQLALPPSWPDDPRILIGNDAFGAAPDFLGGSFNEPFTPLAAPPGRVAVSSTDSGGLRIFIAARGAVLSYTASTPPQMTAVLTYGHPDIAATLVPAPDTSNSVLVAAPDLRGNTSLYACGDSCATVSALPSSQPPELVTGRVGTSPAMVVTNDGQVMGVSADAGRTFVATARPPQLLSMAAVAITNDDLWVAGTDNTHFAVLRAPWSNLTSWTVVANDPALIHDGTIVPINSTRLLYLAVGRGFRCTVDAGSSWMARCPKAT